MPFIREELEMSGQIEPLRLFRNGGLPCVVQSRVKIVGGVRKQTLGMRAGHNQGMDKSLSNKSSLTSESMLAR